MIIGGGRWLEQEQIFSEYSVSPAASVNFNQLNGGTDSNILRFGENQGWVITYNMLVTCLTTSGWAGVFRVPSSFEMGMNLDPLRI